MMQLSATKKKKKKRKEIKAFEHSTQNIIVKNILFIVNILLM